MRVLRNADNVVDIWATYDPEKEGLTKSLKMFEPLLKQPVSHIPHFLRICDALCGNKNCPYAEKVLGMMD